ncbi:MAG: oligosaccharide flippase family protein [Gemmatimonadota bacterium]|nr:oligosaccharide flippase family protein [Gemmatimonadota bacterium]
MSTGLKTIGKQTLVYTGGVVIGKIASFVMLPVYTRYLTPADYGVLELLGMTIEVIGLIAGAGIMGAVFKFYHAEHNQAGKNDVISTAALGVGAIAILVTLVGLIIAPELSKLTFDSEANLPYLRLYFLLFLFQNFEQVPLALIRAENRAGLFVTVNAIRLASMLSLNILFVVYLRMGIQGVLTSSIITSAAVSLGMSGYLVHRVGVGFTPARFRQMLGFGVPLVPWGVGNFILVFSDRFFLNHYTSTSMVGIYSLAYKFAFLLNALAYGPFETIWMSARFEVAKRPDASEIYGRVFFYMNVILGVLGLLLALFVRDFLSVMSDPAFLPAYRVVPLLIAAQVVFIWAAYWSVGIYVSGRTKILATGAIVLVPLTLSLNYVFIPPFGIYGAAGATIVAYAARFFWIYYFAQRYYPIQHQWANVAKLYGILGAAVALGSAYRPEHLLASIGWNTALLLTSIGLVNALVLSSNDRTAVRSIFAGGVPMVIRRLVENASRG